MTSVNSNEDEGCLRVESHCQSRPSSMLGSIPDPIIPPNISKTWNPYRDFSQRRWRDPNRGEA